jgi:hypothetical protein
MLPLITRIKVFPCTQTVTTASVYSTQHTNPWKSNQSSNGIDAETPSWRVLATGKCRGITRVLYQDFCASESAYEQIQSARGNEALARPGYALLSLASQFVGEKPYATPCSAYDILEINPI